MFFPSNYPLFHVVLSTPASVTIIRIRLVSYYQAFLCCNCGLDNNEQMPLVECLTSSISIFSPQSRGYYGYFYSRGAVSAPWLLPPARFIFFRPMLIWFDVGIFTHGQPALCDCRRSFIQASPSPFTSTAATKRCTQRSPPLPSLPVLVCQQWCGQLVNRKDAYPAMMSSFRHGNESIVAF